jgi:hypothetical protein
VGAASSEYGEGDIDVEIGAEPGERRRWATIINHGRGLEEGDRAWLFGRFECDVAGRTSGNGSGPGLIRVARPDAQDGRRPHGGPGRPRPRRDVPLDAPR